MTKTKLLLLTTLGLALSISSCSQETMELPVVTDPYEGCCGVEPVEFTLGGNYVFVPNIFTPNGDGINDIFVPFAKDSAVISNFTILSAVGDTVLFYRPVFSNFFNDSWNGLRADSSEYKGLFRYRMEISSGGSSPTMMQGSACRIVCGTDAEIFQTKAGCFYPSQIDADGQLDATLPNYEEDCFK